SIVAVTDNGGNLIRANRYDSWGRNAPANLGRFRYTGQIWLDDVGLYCYKARLYDPDTGRFLQTDPVVACPPESGPY
ncbi:MAG: RHS repeat-associated core domain-containing protein, partial [Parasphingopyxis sp.]